MENEPSLYAWAGGGAPIAAMINAFYDRVESDDLLGPLFPGGVSAAHRAHVATWGTRLAMHNSKHGADVMPDAPVPHWGWGVAPPYLG